MKAKDHYDNHLSQFYAWMVGDFDQAQRAQESFFRKQNIVSTNRARAIDLGAGHGIQAISLAKLGYTVIAVDFNSNLLEELQHRIGTHPIQCVEDDLLNYLEHASQKADVIVCMGDTLTHLESIDHVERLITSISENLNRGGKVVLSFRDLTHELTGDQRFIPVRSDETKILTCFLEYFPDHAMVHDILHERIDSKWIQKVSCYPKLRFNQQLIESFLIKTKINLVSCEIINRMIYIVGEKA